MRFRAAALRFPNVSKLDTKSEAAALRIPNVSKLDTKSGAAALRFPNVSKLDTKREVILSVQPPGSSSVPLEGYPSSAARQKLNPSYS